MGVIASGITRFIINEEGLSQNFKIKSPTRFFFLFFWVLFPAFFGYLGNNCHVTMCHMSIADWLVLFISREYVDTWHVDT
jgi:hypothetical protein